MDELEQIDMSTDLTHPAPEQDLSGIVGRRITYTYANGWQYVLYVKNATTIDYHVVTGDVGGRVVKDQPIDLVRIDDDSYKLSWTEPTGTCVAVNYLPGLGRVHGSTFFPHWIALDGSAIAVFQNEHLDEMEAKRDAGPTYPIRVITEFATITAFDHIGSDDETVIAPVAAGERQR